MKYYGIDSIGEIKIEYVDSLPTWIDEYNRRIVLNYADGYMYFGYYAWIKLTNYSDVIDAINHVDLTNNPHNVTTNQINAVPLPDFNDHITDYDDPHQTLGNYQGPGYIIYRTETTQTSFDALNPITYEEVADSYNVNGRVSIDAGNNTFTLQKGYYNISYLGFFQDLVDNTSHPDVSMVIYNVTTGSYLNYTHIQGEIDPITETITLSFSFPIFLSEITELEVHMQTNLGSPNQRAQLNESTMAIEIPLALEKTMAIEIPL